jgi:hypothetical protein
VTHTLDAANARAHHNCSIRRASGFVQTPLASSMPGPEFRENGISGNLLPPAPPGRGNYRKPDFRKRYDCSVR